MDVLRDYLALLPRADEPAALLFPAFQLTPPKQTGVAVDPNADAPEWAGAKVQRNADALASLTVDEAEQRLELDWTSRVRHQNFYKACSVRRCFELTEKAEAERYRPPSSFTRCATPTRVSALRPESAPWRYRDSWDMRAQ